MAKLRVTYVLEGPVWGGAEAYVVSLIELFGDRIEPSVVAVGPVPARLFSAVAGRASITRVAAVRGKLDVISMVRLARAVRGTRPDLVHVNLNAPANNRYGILASITTRAPAVATLHLPLALGSAPQRLVLSALYRCLDGVIVVSDEARALLVNELRTPADRITLIHNGVAEVPSGDRHLVRPNRSPLVVGALARLVEHKGMDVLIEAVRQLSNDDAPVQLRIGGDGPELEALQQRSAGLPVRFDGEVTDVSAWFRGLDVFCLPSRSEGLPLALLEALMAGLPCVATDVGQIRQALGPVVALVPPGQVPPLVDALRTLRTDEGLRAELSALGRSLVARRHSAEGMAAATDEIYQEVTRSRRAYRRP